MSVTPDFIGQIYKDTNTGNLWRANSLTPGDWTLELQNAQVFWLPRSEKYAESMAISSFAGAFVAVPLTSLRYDMAVLNDYIDIEDADLLTTIEFPNLATWNANADCYILNCDSLQTVRFQSLVSMDVGSNLEISGNPLLTTIDLPNFVPKDGMTMTFTTNALTASCVNALLAMCVANPAYVSGLIDLHLGTSAAPTGQGIVDKATLNARQVGLAVTN